MPPRKDKTETMVVAEPVAPGPIHLEVRVDGRIKFLQRVHSYTIDQQDDHATIVGILKPPMKVEPAPLNNVVKAAPTAEMRFEAAGNVTKEETL